MSRTFAASYEASPDSVALVRNQVAALAADCGLDESAVGDVRLAVSEAATNALVHGYRGDPAAGVIHVEARLQDGELCIAISDDGEGLKPRTDSPGLGLGLPIMARLAKHVEIGETGTGAQVRLTFACPTA